MKMKFVLKNLAFVLVLISMVSCQQRLDVDSTAPSYLDIESPNFFSFTPSPLRQPESLKQRPYFDFLSTLYRHDRSKSNLFNAYNQQPANARRQLQKREAGKNGHNAHSIQKRAIVFRPLFVYRQQQVRKQILQESRRRY